LQHPPPAPQFYPLIYIYKGELGEGGGGIPNCPHTPFGVVLYPADKGRGMGPMEAMEGTKNKIHLLISHC